jgi:hypothetical protein
MKKAHLGCDRQGKLQQRAWLAVLFGAVGCGGEIKFVDTAKWMWHPQFVEETVTSVKVLGEAAA